MLTKLEMALLEMLRADPLVSSNEMARRLETSREAVRVHLSNLGKKGEILGRGYVLRDDPGVVVIGGANIDIKAQSDEAVIASTSNPGRTSSSAGGVGRNIAENLGRLGTRTHLIAAIGTDADGDRLLDETRASGVNVDHVLRSSAATGTYTAVLDSNGELVVAIADMAASAELDSAWVLRSRDVIARADFVVLDGNLELDVIGTALDIATSASKPVLIDPVSDPKALALVAALDPSRPVSVITPNVSELAALTNLATRTDRQLATAAKALHQLGVANVWIRLGKRGSLMSSTSPDRSHAPTIVEIPALPATVVDVTGAGDAMAATYVHTRLGGATVTEAAHVAHAAAALTIESEYTVRPDLTSALIGRRLNHSTTRRSPTPSGSPSQRKRQEQK